MQKLLTLTSQFFFWRLDYTVSSGFSIWDSNVHSLFYQRYYWIFLSQCCTTILYTSLWKDTKQGSQTEIQGIPFKLQKKTLSTLTVVKYCNSLPRDLMEPPNLEILKTLRNLLLLTLLWAGVWTSESPEASLDLNLLWVLDCKRCKWKLWNIQEWRQKKAMRRTFSLLL